MVPEREEGYGEHDHGEERDGRHRVDVGRVVQHRQRHDHPVERVGGEEEVAARARHFDPAHDLAPGAVVGVICLFVSKTSTKKQRTEMKNEMSCWVDLVVVVVVVVVVIITKSHNCLDRSIHRSMDSSAMLLGRVFVCLGRDLLGRVEVRRVAVVGGVGDVGDHVRAAAEAERDGERDAGTLADEDEGDGDVGGLRQDEVWGVVC